MDELDPELVAKEVSSKIDAIEASYMRELEKYADKVVEKYVKPFCDAYGGQFVAGMGAWALFFYDERGDVVLADMLFSDRHDHLMRYNRLYHIANEAVGQIANYYGYDLGSVAHDYTSPDFGKILVPYEYNEEEE